MVLQSTSYVNFNRQYSMFLCHTFYKFGVHTYSDYGAGYVRASELLLLERKIQNTNIDYITLYNTYPLAGMHLIQKVLHNLPEKSVRR